MSSVLSQGTTRKAASIHSSGPIIRERFLKGPGMSLPVEEGKSTGSGENSRAGSDPL